MKILVSACLLGTRCRYDGKSAPNAQICALAEQHVLIPVCPEQLGGLPTPRNPAEQQGARVVTQNGQDVTVQFTRGAEQALHLAQLLQCDCALLKAKSPSCGAGQIYDSTFSRTLTAGNGITTQLLAQQGLPVFTEQDLQALADFCRG